MIIDASVAFKWIVDEEGSAKALALIGQEPLDAPALIHAEVGNALWKRISRDQLEADGDAAEHLASLSQLINIRDETLLMPRALEMAIQLNHPIYDCVYLAMAEAVEVKLVTADTRFLATLRGTQFETLVMPL